MFEKYDIVLGDFPFEEGEGSKRRPALVIDTYEVAPISAKITSSITNHSNTYVIKNWEEAGLLKPCMVDLNYGKLKNISPDRFVKTGHLTEEDIKNLEEIMSKDKALRYLLESTQIGQLMWNQFIESLTPEQKKKFKKIRSKEMPLPKDWNTAEDDNDPQNKYFANKFMPQIIARYKNQLELNEDVNETTTENTDEGMRSLINDSLQKCWDLYNSLSTLRINSNEYGYEDLGNQTKVIEDQQYVVIGTLEGLLQSLDPNAEQIAEVSTDIVDEIEGASNE